MKKAAIIGGGPTGLFAADRLVREGVRVDLYERKSLPGRKFLLAGQSGLNITNDEIPGAMCERYGRKADFFRSCLEEFSSEDLRSWLGDLGVKTYRGNGGKVFPERRTPLEILSLWLSRLEETGLFHLHCGYQWSRWEGDFPLLEKGNDTLILKDLPVLFALGGASWPETGSDGLWHFLLEEKNIPCVSFKPMNCAFTVDWSSLFNRDHFNKPVKNIALDLGGERKRGDLLIREDGVEGGPVYWFSLALRETLEKQEQAVIAIDLMPDLTLDKVRVMLKKRPAKKSLTSYLKSTGRFSAMHLSLLLELTTGEERSNGEILARRIKGLPLILTGTDSLERAISSSGGVDFSSLDGNLMIKERPGWFVAGEMADWEAPTGGYMLQGCLAMANRAAQGMMGYLP